MKQLWVEKYRPTSVKHYVFRNTQQRDQVQQWIDSGTVPHLLFSGPAGTGKCLGPDTEITVKFDFDRLTDEQKKKLDQILANRPEN